MRWECDLSALLGAVGARFARVETRRHAGALVRGMPARLARVNWPTIAEHAGQARPDALQHLLARAVWDEDGVRDDLRGYVVENLSSSPDGDDEGGGVRRDVLVVDETGDVKKGVDTVGVQRQYTGTAGRIENSQVAVHLVFAGRRGHAFIDRELYLPKAWTEDPQRCAAAGIPAEVKFATKPALARAMLERALTDGDVRVGWLAGDEGYGADPALRRWCRAQRLGYLLAIARTTVSPPALASAALSTWLCDRT